LASNPHRSAILNNPEERRVKVSLICIDIQTVHDLQLTRKKEIQKSPSFEILNMEVSEQQARIDAITWCHEFDFGNGLKAQTTVDEGSHRLGPLWE